MEQFLVDLANIYDLILLFTLKENVKNQVTNSNLTWLERADLYKKVQLINQRIELLLHDPVC